MEQGPTSRSSAPSTKRSGGFLRGLSQRGAEALSDFLWVLLHVHLPDAQDAMATLCEIDILSAIHSPLTVLLRREHWKSHGVAMPIVAVELDDQICCRHEGVHTPLVEHDVLGLIDYALSIKHGIARRLQFGLPSALYKAVDLRKSIWVRMATGPRAVNDAVLFHPVLYLARAQLEGAATELANMVSPTSSLPGIRARTGTKQRLELSEPPRRGVKACATNDTCFRSSCAGPLGPDPSLWGIYELIASPRTIDLPCVSGARFPFIVAGRAGFHRSAALAASRAVTFGSPVSPIDLATYFAGSILDRACCPPAGSAAELGIAAVAMARDLLAARFALPNRLASDIHALLGAEPPRPAHIEPKNLVAHFTGDGLDQESYLTCLAAKSDVAARKFSSALLASSDNVRADCETQLLWHNALQLSRRSPIGRARSDRGPESPIDSVCHARHHRLGMWACYQPGLTMASLSSVAWGIS